MSAIAYDVRRKIREHATLSEDDKARLKLEGAINYGLIANA